MSILQTCVATSVFAGTFAAMIAQSPGRPHSVPSGYVTTPFGYFHPSCVQSLAKGERLLPDGRVEHADGSSNERAAVCNYPHYTPSGTPVTANVPAAPPEVSGWVENANITTGSSGTSYGGLIAVWTVPPQPIANDGQFLYFFPGLEDIDDTQSILQPVLSWHGGQWAIASWNCCLSNTVTESPAVNVNPGDVIYSSITSACAPGALSCSTWNVLALDLSTGQSTTLSDTPSDGQVFNWAFGGVMEPYYVVSCKDYPPDRRLKFDHVIVFDENKRPLRDPEWSSVAGTAAAPQCNYNVEAGRDEVTLDY
ncbi:MAG TPA: hypothetical protein VMB49_08010 [Acidobacteriaceae bacterium]|nr:hypothetical protein [Acidobacteriaceae bacterium]